MQTKHVRKANYLGRSRDAQPCRRGLVRLSPRETDQFQLRILLGTIVSHNIEETEKLLLTVMRGHECATALVPDQYVISHELVYGLTQRAYGNTESLT